MSPLRSAASISATRRFRPPDQFVAARGEGLAQGGDLDHRAVAAQLADLFRREAEHEGAALRLDVHQPFHLQAHQRFRTGVLLMPMRRELRFGHLLPSFSSPATMPSRRRSYARSVSSCGRSTSRGGRSFGV